MQPVTPRTPETASQPPDAAGSKTPDVALPPAAPLPAPVSVETGPAPDELDVPLLTVLAIALPHALLLVVLEVLTSAGEWRSERGPGTAFALFLVVLFVLPGAMTGWFVRGRGFSVKRWLMLASAEWVFAAGFVGLAMAAQPIMGHSVALRVFAAPIVIFLMIVAALAVTQPRRNRLARPPYRGHARKRRINMSTNTVPVGDWGTKGVDAPTFERGSAGKIPLAGHPLPAPASIETGAAPDELGVPILTLLAIALPHALVLIVLEALTRQSAWRGGKEAGTVFGLALTFLFVVPGALAGWYVRGRSFNFKRWLTLAGSEWLLAATTLAVGILADLPALVAGNGDWGNVVFFGIPIFAALVLIAALALTQPRGTNPKE